MKRIRGVAGFAVALGVAQPCLASLAGADPMSFLFIDVNARSVAMGSAYTALAEDANALAFNPAGLGLVRRDEATFSHNQYFQGIMQESAALATHQGWGANLNYLNFGDAKRTTLSSPGGGLGNVGMTDMAVSAGYGHALFGALSIGAVAKYLQETIDNFRVQSAALDAGALYKPPQIRGLALGLTFQNIGPALHYQAASSPLPFNLRAGAAYSFPLYGQEETVAFDLSKERSESILIGAGIESRFAKTLAVRLGYNSRNDAGPGLAVGVGYRYGNIDFDYAFSPYGDLGITQRASVTVRWGVMR